MSGFRDSLRARLERQHPRWAREWDALMRDDELQAALNALRRRGGDPDFALLILTHFRWRSVKALPALKERTQVLRAIHLLVEGEGHWCRELREMSGEDWARVDTTLRTGAQLLLSFHHADESMFESMGTRHETETPRTRSGRASTCLLVLDWHLHQVTGTPRSDRRLLARLLSAFGMMQGSDHTGVSADPERWIEKRLERASTPNHTHRSTREYVETFIIPSLFWLHHAVHRSCGLDCGSACRPFERHIRAEDQVRLLDDVQEAQACVSRGDSTEARGRFENALKRADALLGPNHVGVASILAGYAEALRAVGDTQAAETAATRSTSIFRASGRESQELIAFTPGAGPHGELVPVWVERAASGCAATAR